MKRSLLVSLAAVVILGSLGSSNRNASATISTPDLTGAWRLDPSQSNLPRRPGGPGAPGGQPGGPGGWERGGGEHSGPRPDGTARRGGPPGGRPGNRFPRLLRIEMNGSTIRLADSTGVALQIVSTGDTPPKPPAADSTALRLTGHWKGGQLEVQRPGRQGSLATDTYSLEDAGETLVIRTKMEAKSELDAADLKRVYHRES